MGIRGPEERRRKVVIDPTLQVRLVLRIVGVLVVSLAVFLLLSLGGSALVSVLGESDWATTALLYRKDVLLRLVLFPTIGTCSILFVWAMRETLRISGPCVRFSEVLQSLRQWRIPKEVQIRKHDYFQEVALQMSQTLDTWRSGVADMQLHSHKARRALEGMQAMPEHQQEYQAGMQSLRELDVLLQRIDLTGDGMVEDDSSAHSSMAREECASPATSATER